jgi:hypothetical protein
VRFIGHNAQEKDADSQRIPRSYLCVDKYLMPSLTTDGGAPLVEEEEELWLIVMAGLVEITAGGR